MSFNDWFDSWLRDHLEDINPKRPFLYSFEVYGFLFAIEKNTLRNGAYSWSDFELAYQLKVGRVQAAGGGLSSHNRRLTANNRGYRNSKYIALFPYQIADCIWDDAINLDAGYNGDYAASVSNLSEVGRASRFLERVKEVWEEQREQFRKPGGYRSSNMWRVLDWMVVDEGLAPVKTFTDECRRIDEHQNEMTEDGMLSEYKNAFVKLFTDLYVDHEYRNSAGEIVYWCVGETESKYLASAFTEAKVELSDTLVRARANNSVNSSPDEANDESEKVRVDNIGGFNCSKYVTDLASLSYFSNLIYRSDVEVGHLEIEAFVPREVLIAGERRSLADLVDFGDTKIKILTSKAGEGKTSCLIALIRSFGSENGELSLLLGFGEDDRRKRQIPFFYSFNPGRGLSRSILDEGSYSEILENLMCGRTMLPELGDLEKLIETLGDKAFFVLDALDEAAELSLAIKAINGLARRFPQAGIIVASRPLSQRPQFASEDDSFCRLMELPRAYKIELIKRHLADSNKDVQLTEEAMISCAEELVDGKYTSKIISTPIFACVASRGMVYDKNKGGFKAASPGSAYRTVSNVLLEKSAGVLEKWLDSLVSAEEAESDASSTLELHQRAKKLFRRLALVTFLRSKLSGKLKSSFNDIATEVNMATKDGLKWDLVKRLMRQIAQDLSFPEKSCEPNAWKQYLIASGIVSCSPDERGGVFLFDNREMQIYLAACGLSDLLESNRQTDCFGLLRDLLNASPDEELAKLVVMLLFCVDPGNEGSMQSGPGYVECEVIGSSLEIVNCVICELAIPDEDTAGYSGLKHRALLQALEDVRYREFGDSVLVRFQSGTGDGAFLYRDILDSEIGWLEGKIAACK